jgi:hypothetical protein
MSIDLQLNRAVSAEDCDFGPEPGVDMTAGAIVGAMAARRGLTATGQGPAEVGTLTGQQVDLRLDEAVGVTCPGEDGGYVPLFGAMESYGWGFLGVLPEERFRLIALDVPGDQNLMIVVSAPDATTYDRHIGEAETIIEHLAFEIES